MTQVAILIFAGTETRADLGRAVNAFQVAREFEEGGDDVSIVLDGAGTQWVPALGEPDHKYHGLYDRTKHLIAGACSYCAGAFGVKDEIARSDVDLLDEFEGHPSIRKFVTNGYQVLTF